jgi:hypothetical protein
MHMEPGFSISYVREFIRSLAPGGLLAFQLPEPTSRQRLREALPRPVVKTVNRLRTLREPMMEISGVPRPQVEQLVAQAGGRLLRADARGALQEHPRTTVLGHDALTAARGRDSARSRERTVLAAHSRPPRAWSRGYSSTRSGTKASAAATPTVEPRRRASAVTASAERGCGKRRISSA